MGRAGKLDDLFNAPTDLFASQDQVIENFYDLAAAIKKSEGFSHFKITADDHKIQLAFEGLSIYLLNTTVWQDKNLFEDYAQISEELTSTVLCLGADADFSQTYDRFLNSHIDFLFVPTNLGKLNLKIRRALKTKSLVAELKQREASSNKQSDTVKYILSISRELNGVRDIPHLLSLILQRTREITGADAGSIYTVDIPEHGDVRSGSIHFKITQNSSVQQNLNEFSIPINEDSIVGNAVLKKTNINIEDLYSLEQDPSQNPFGVRHDSSWDRRIGYECHSMLTVPLFDISHQVIGVIQLINRKRDDSKTLSSPADFREQVIPFDDKTIEYAEIIAHQAGIALENAMLTDEKEALFEGFVNASVKAIEQRDPTTSGHSGRVAELTTGLARQVDRLDFGKFRDITFNVDQLKEIEYASLLHDFGKAGVSEKVLVKAKKLYPWEQEALGERWELIRSRLEVQYLREYTRYLETPSLYPPGFSPEQFRGEMDAKLKDLEQYFHFIMHANEPTVLEQAGFEKLKDIANQTFRTSTGELRPYLRANELKALSVSRGSLTREEFAEIQSHVTHTYEFLRKIPWGKKFANIPQIAAKHHEKLDGSGYPNGAVAEEIPIQSRMMTIADIYDALTAADRPYKKAVPAEKALDIIEQEVKAGKCDADLFRVFVESGVYKITLD